MHCVVMLYFIRELIIGMSARPLTSLILLPNPHSHIQILSTHPGTNPHNWQIVVVPHLCRAAQGISSVDGTAQSLYAVHMQVNISIRTQWFTPETCPSQSCLIAEHSIVEQPSEMTMFRLISEDAIDLDYGVWLLLNPVFSKFLKV
jgi:hypothetical protein